MSTNTILGNLYYLQHLIGIISEISEAHDATATLDDKQHFNPTRIEGRRLILHRLM